jgi:hypothetical protein
MSEQALPPARHERRDVGFGAMAIGLGLGGVFVVLLVVVIGFVFPVHRLDRPIARNLPAAPAPRLQPSPRAEMATFYAKEMQRLNSAGWVDQAAGIVHIPIDQAMQETAQRGIPDWPTSKRIER